MVPRVSAALQDDLLQGGEGGEGAHHLGHRLEISLLPECHETVVPGRLRDSKVAHYATVLEEVELSFNRVWLKVCFKT
jgi:hypothetical protein